MTRSPALDLPVDHFVVLVTDLAAARARFVDAGFNATPVAHHSAQMGTANSCIMLEGVYVELMGMVAETPSNEGWRSLLAAGPGLKGIALASDDIEATAAALAGHGIAVEPPRHFSRATDEGELRFSVIRLPQLLTPGLQCIHCQHHTPDLLWTSASMHHANGAKRIREAVVPGSAPLASLPDPGAPRTLPVRDGQAGTLEIDAAQPIPAGQLDAIAATTGLTIRTRAGG